jgi:hypothetical protein
MEIIGDRTFVEVPGHDTHELPPLVVRSAPRPKRMDRVLDMATAIVESEDLLTGHEELGPDLDFERRRMDLAVNLAEQYLGLLAHWSWGDAILEWIRQCETTFDTKAVLRRLLRTDIWPHAARSSFVTLLRDKAVHADGFALEQAVGLRLTFRQPPPISCFSNQFLFYLNSTVATSAYDTWARMSPAPVSALPPERFSFQVVSSDMLV